MQRVGSFCPQGFPVPVSLESGIWSIKQELTKQDVPGIIATVLEAPAAKRSRIIPLMFTPEWPVGPGRTRLPMRRERCGSYSRSPSGWLCRLPQVILEYSDESSHFARLKYFECSSIMLGKRGVG